MIGQTISHYRVVSQLGVGGMGVVYEALDPRLGRPVAIKFVPEELSHDMKAMERLRGEARTASGLNHPNICTIYDVGEHEGRPYIVMELLKGQTLRDRIATKPLKMHEAVDVGIQVADALDVAHSSRIIHRDIKPANLFIVDRGQVKVLDFGLAKLLNRDMGTQLTLAPTIDQTAAGIAMGTVAYMSPEQVQGEELDNRTDLFSLGVVLYECVTGRQPFTGKTAAVVFSQILTQAPVAPIAVNPDVPSRLQDVINNCLEKDREMRYQEAASLRADLKRVKRDLESGAASVAATGAVSTRGSAPGSSGARTTVSTPITASTPVQGVSPAESPNSRGKWVGIGLVVAAAVVGGSFWASRDGGSEPQVAQAPAAPVVPPQTASPEPSTAPAPALAPANTIDPKQLEATIAEATRRQVDEELQRRAAAERAQAATDTPRLPATRQPAPTPRASAQPPVSSPPQAPAPAPAPAQTSTPEPAAVVNQPAPQPAVVAPPPVTPPARASELPAAVANAPAPRPEPQPERRTPTPAPAEDDDAAIRRVVANYARAIETKNLGLYREVKPNLTADEAKRIEAGFSAVTSQRVSITVDSIERRGQEAIVRLRRHDVIQAGGRQQAADSQQTMTFTHAGGTWVIREIR